MGACLLLGQMYGVGGWYSWVDVRLWNVYSLGLTGNTFMKSFSFPKVVATRTVYLTYCVRSSASHTDYIRRKLKVPSNYSVAAVFFD